MSFRRFAWLGCLVLSLGGCAAPVPWQHPSLPKDHWQADWNSCRRGAEGQVGYRDSDTDSNFRDYDRAQAKKRVSAYVDMCMRDRGYVPVRSAH